MCKALWSFKAQMPCDLTFTAGESGIYLLYYFVPVGERSIAISLSGSLSVCEHISWNYWIDLPKFCVQISCGRGSVLLGQHCHTLCTSAFVDDIMFGSSGP